MEMEYKDPNRRGRYIVILGVALALVAGGAAYYTINQAQQQAGQGGLQTVTIVVALKEIPARKAIEAADVGTRSVPIDDTNAQGVFSDASKVIGLVPSVRILAGQPVYANLLGTGSQGGTLVILDPGEVVTPTSEAWRAVSMTVPDDRAVGGLLKAGDTVDVFVTLSILVPQSLIEAGKFYTDRSTKITYQNLTVLAKATSSYIVKVPENLAEEISHLQASGAASFSFALRPPSDTRIVDATRLGETTSIIIQRYGLPIPVVYPTGAGGVVLPGSTLPPSPSPAPSGSAPSGSGSPDLNP
jgi:Flp pilus assembly protein CpaB